MKLGRKNEILKVSDVKIGMVLTFKGLNELTGPDGDYYDKRKGKRPLFSIGSIGELFFDKKFRINESVLKRLLLEQEDKCENQLAWAIWQYNK